jgi:predicted nucleic acid-binding protein
MVWTTLPWRHTAPSCRRAGVTIRKTLDRLIAAPCVRTGAPILHSDADFGRLAECTPLRLHS